MDSPELFKVVEEKTIKVLKPLLINMEQYYIAKKSEKFDVQYISKYLKEDERERANYHTRVLIPDANKILCLILQRI